MICEAILKIKADAEVSVSGDNIDTCIFEWLDGNPTNITRAEIKSKLAEIKAKLNTEEQEVIVKKASGKQKLKDLGLDDDEIKALLGA